MATLHAPNSSSAARHSAATRRNVNARAKFWGSRAHTNASTFQHCDQTRSLLAAQGGGLRSVTARSTPGPSPQSTQVPEAPPTQWLQRTVVLPPYPRGCHVITRRFYEAVPELSSFEVGLAHIFIQHTSASLTINENASPDVPLDLNDALNRLVPEGRHFRHDEEGADDMPAHVKSSLMGPSLALPVHRGRLALGTWQGIYLNEHRNNGGPRSLVVTIQGQVRSDGGKYGPAWAF